MSDNNAQTVQPLEIIKINQLNDFLYDLKTCDHYVSKSEYLPKLKEYKEVIDFFNVLKKSDLLNDYCNKNRLSSKGIIQLIDLYNEYDKAIDKHNDLFIENKLVEEKEYLDNILKEVDPAIVLDKNQREVVLNDEDYILVIAGAGAGKTTTVAAKAKYLIEKKGIPANEILIVSFTNKAVNELREKINKDLKLECIISTFHSIGNAILKTQSTDNTNVVMEGRQYYILLNYFKNSVFTNKELTKKLVLFFSTYFDVPYEGDDISKFLNELSRTNYTTLKSDLNEIKQDIIDARSKKKETIQNEVVRSYQEVQIANYLYLNNIDYKYEPIYKYNIKLANKPYTPDFIIKQGNNEAYLEHFGISQDGENSMYSKEQLEKYKKAVNDKILLHREHGTKLIYTFSQYNDGRSLLQHLDEELRKNGFIPKKKDEKEVLNKIIETEENKYVSKLLVLICRFINLFKTNGYTIEEFDKFKNSTRNVRNHLFLDICKECYLEYERYLKENNMIDFQDMINNSAILLKEMADKKEKLRFKYVIVDEYQDISRQRFDLVGALHKVSDAKIVAVGDDWQSIYAFSGSDVELFLEFQRKMGYAKVLKIENTYRNSQEVIDIAGNFVQKNDTQIKKTLRSPKHIEDPIIIYTYDSTKKDYKGNNKSGSNYNLAMTTERCIEDILEYDRKDNKKNGKILILGRYNYDINNLEKSGLFEVVNKQGKIRSLKYPNLDITFMTVHASKGLGYDNVIIINCINAKFGFPSKIQDDPVLKHVIIEDTSYDYAEERRLFYVAMTRTKNRVYCVAPNKYPSEFLVEIYKDYEKIVKHGEWVEGTNRVDYRNRCPICGYPMQFKYKPAFGLRLFICTNDPEVCGFMTNEIKAGKMQIMKCDKCQDGYMIVKPSEKGYFLGCTNYKPDGTGCNNVISEDKYYELASLTPDKAVRAKAPIRSQERKTAERDMTIVPEKGLKYEIRKYNLKNNKDLSDFYTVSKIIISCVNHVSQKKYLGKKKITDILFGIVPENMKNMNVRDIPEFKALFLCNRYLIGILLNTLIESKYLLLTREKYPVLHPTIEGKDFLENYDNTKITKLYKEFCNNQKESNNKKDSNVSTKQLAINKETNKTNLVAKEESSKKEIEENNARSIKETNSRKKSILTIISEKIKKL